MAKRSGTAPRRGRPPSPPDEGKRHAFGFRTTKRIRDLIEQASRQSGRSAAQEIEIRIEKSFYDEALVEQAFEAEHPKPLAALARLVVWAMHEAGRLAAVHNMNAGSVFGEGWLYHPYSYGQAVDAVKAVLEHYRPEGDQSPPTDGIWIGVPGSSYEESVTYLNTIGNRVAAALINAVDNPELCGEPQDVIERAHKIRKKLGSYIGGRFGRFIGPSTADQANAEPAGDIETSPGPELTDSTKTRS